MFRLLLLSCVSIILTSAAIFIDRSTLDFNKEIGNLTTTYYHNEKGNSITNLTMRTFKTIHKMLAYVKVKLAEDENDRECRREFLRTIVDVEKLNKGAQANFLVKAYMENIRRFMDFDIKLPLQPGTHRFVNFTFDHDHLPLIQDTRGSIEFRIVVKVEGSKAMKYFARITYYGGYRKPTQA